MRELKKPNAAREWMRSSLSNSFVKERGATDLHNKCSYSESHASVKSTYSGIGIVFKSLAEKPSARRAS